MTFKVGTRVKKVRGQLNTGVTGIVMDCSPNRGPPFDMMVFVDQSYLDVVEEVPSKRPPGMAYAVSGEWEPIIPEGHKPCEEGFDIDYILECSKEIETYK